MPANAHRTTIKKWAYASPPRWYWIAVAPPLAVGIVSIVVFFFTLESPPSWIAPLWTALHFIIWPLLAAGFIHSYVRIYKGVSSPTAAQ